MSTKARKIKNDHCCQAKGLSINEKGWKRKAAYNFTGCLAHIDLTYHPVSLNVLWITGILIHNKLCLKKVMTCLPGIPLHTHVWQVALQQLNDGARCKL